VTRALSDHMESFDGAKSASRAGAARGAMRGIGQAPQRIRDANSDDRRPGFSAPWPRYASWPITHIAPRSAPRDGAEYSRSNVSIWSERALV
jgi:hypothetical protein